MLKKNPIMKKIIEEPDNCGAHVVLLGAGASLAAFPKGDANEKPLPVMNDLVKELHLRSLLEKNNISPSGNFESIYSKLEDEALKKEIENKIFYYFISLELPETATIYDKLLLSLREKDAIFTFNWDPFLFDAYQRNRNVTPLPNIYFLHGNVRIGACETCNNMGRKLDLCTNCNKRYVDVPLLYPVGKKKYFEENRYTKMSWEAVNCWFADAFTITIFGYSAPTSDQEAVELLEKAWFKKSNRELGYVEVIDIIPHDQLAQNWKKFIPTHRFLPSASFKGSRLWNWPRRSCEALFYPMTQAIICKEFPLKETNNLNELQTAIKEIAKYED